MRNAFSDAHHYKQLWKSQLFGATNIPLSLVLFLSSIKPWEKYLFLTAHCSIFLTSRTFSSFQTLFKIACMHNSTPVNVLHTHCDIIKGLNYIDVNGSLPAVILFFVRVSVLFQYDQVQGSFWCTWAQIALQSILLAVELHSRGKPEAHICRDKFFIRKSYLWPYSLQ